eukprot:9273492-Pyramimonas_sp.AAC.1
MISEATKLRRPPAPSVLADAIRILGKQAAAPLPAAGAPTEEFARARDNGTSSFQFAQQACWMECQRWRKSAGAHASAVQLWGHAAALTAQP